jgi:hypothetical protein
MSRDGQLPTRMFKRSPAKQLLALAGAVAFIGIFWLIPQMNPALLWLATSVFGLFAILGVVNLVTISTGKYCLILDNHGWTSRHVLGTYFFPWRECSEFYIYEQHQRGVRVSRTVMCRTENDALISRFQRLFEPLFPRLKNTLSPGPGFSISEDELCALMNEYRENALAEMERE